MSNVLEFYGGNEDKMRDMSKREEVDFNRELKAMNSNMQGSLVKTPKPFERK